MGTCPRTARTARAAFSLPLHDAQQRPERAMPGRPLGACGTHPRGHQLRIGWYQWQQGVQHRLACMQPLRGVSLAMFSHTRPNRREPSLLLSGGPLKFSRPMRLRHRISEFDVLNFCCMRRLAQRFSEKGGGSRILFGSIGLLLHYVLLDCWLQNWVPPTRDRNWRCSLGSLGLIPVQSQSRPCPHGHSCLPSRSSPTPSLLRNAVQCFLSSPV